jgi:hypothetical protein
MTHLIKPLAKILAAGFALTAFAAVPASATIASPADCEYEGGEVFDVEEGKVCMVPIRPAEFEGEAYDGQQLGITECTGSEVMDGAWCKIVLVPAPPKPEMDAEEMSMEVVEEDE